MVEKKNCECLNVGVDGESLQLATKLPNGVPGTELSLAKCILKKLQTFNKDTLAKFVIDNPHILIDFGSVEEEEESDDLEELPIGEDVLVNLEESLAAIQQNDNDESFSLEDIEDLLTCENNLINKSREAVVKKYSIVKLRELCLKHIFPAVKRKWLVQNYGKENLKILFQDGSELLY